MTHAQLLANFRNNLRNSEVKKVLFVLLIIIGTSTENTIGSSGIADCVC